MARLPLRRRRSSALLRDRGHGRVDDRRDGAGGPVLLAHRRARRRATRSAAIEAQVAPARGGRRARRSRRWPPALPTLARGRRPRGVHRARAARCRCAPAATGCSPPTRWAPAGWAPTRRPASPNPCGELHDTPGVWIGDAQRLPDLLGHQPDDLDHGARPPHRGGDRRRAPASRGRRRRRQRPRPDEESTDMAVSRRTPGRPRQALHRRRVGRARRRRRRSTSIDPTTEEVMGRIPEGTPEDVDRAVAAARAAFEAWSQTPRRRARRAAARRSPRASAARGEEIAATDRRTRSACRSSLSQHDPGRPADDDVRARCRSCSSEVALGGGDRQLAGRARAGRRASARSRRGTTRCTRSPRRSRRRWPPAAPSC